MGVNQRLTVAVNPIKCRQSFTSQNFPAFSDTRSDNLPDKYLQQSLSYVNKSKQLERHNYICIVFLKIDHLHLHHHQCLFFVHLLVDSCKVPECLYLLVDSCKIPECSYLLVDNCKIPEFVHIC